MLSTLRYFAYEYASRLFFRALHMAEYRKAEVQAIDNLRRDLAAGALHRTGYVDHYDEAAERATWHKYKAEAGGGEPAFRAAALRRLVAAELAADPTIRNVVNWGAAYGVMESEIAKAFPGVTVWGLDRRDVTRDLNRAEFSAPNLRFEAVPDIFGWTAGLDRALFCHANIGTYFLPAFLAKLYRHVAAAGATVVVLLEPSGRSRQTHRYFDYSTEPRATVVFRGARMLLNNYPALLAKAGFKTASMNILRPPHPDPDFRSIAISAKKG